jgi:hypothetical protein
MSSSLRFVGTCIGLRAKDLHAYDDTERAITYRTFRSHVGREVTTEINTWAGWPGTHFSNDGCIRYGKGKWKGKPAVCMHHSGIHHLWLV